MVVRQLKTAIWKKWKRRSGLKNGRDEEMWIKILGRRMERKQRKEEADLLQRSCHPTHPN